MKSERERKVDSTKRNANIATIIGVFIAALTLLFGSGIMLPLFSNPSATPSMSTEDTSNNSSSEDMPTEEATGQTNDNELSVPPAVEGTSAPSSDDADNQIAVSGAVLSSNDSRIRIENATLVDDGFYFEAPDDNWFISMKDLVLVGSFTYSSELTEDEKKNWGHGGHLLNSDGVRCYEEETSFWSDYDAMQFAVDLPEDIEPGIYTYVLYQFISDQQISASIQFEIY